MSTGLSEFKKLWKEFRGFSTLAVGGSLAVPFVAAVADLAPPWPTGITVVTAIVQFVVVVFIFHFFQKAKRATINRVVIAGFITTFLAAAAYLVLFSTFTFVIPTTKERHLKGFTCTENAQLVFGRRCPNLGLDELRGAEYEAERLWTLSSITAVRLSIVALWCAAFIGLATTLSSFLVFHMRKPPAKTKRETTADAVA